MKHKLLKCKCGARFVNDGVFLTCPACRKPFTEEQKQAQTGCYHYAKADEGKRVFRRDRTFESF